MVRVTVYKTEGAGSIPDGIATAFALILRLPKNNKSSLQEPFMVLQEGFHLESLKVPAER